jgi:hypothetical protein
LDRTFGEYVRDGYIDSNRLQDLIERKTEQSRYIESKDKAINLHRKVGDVLWTGLNNNVDEILATMNESLEANVLLYPSIEHLNQYIFSLREIGEDKAADNLIMRYIDLTKDKDTSYLTLSDIHWNFLGKPDDKMAAAIQHAYKEKRVIEVDKIVQNLDRQEKLKDISERASKYNLTREDYETLARFDEADFLTFLQRYGGVRSANDFVQHFLSARPCFAEHEADHKAIGRKIIAIVEKSAQESKLNHFRLRGYLNVIAVAAQTDGGTGA